MSLGIPCAVATGILGVFIAAVLSRRLRLDEKKRLTIFNWNILAPIWIDLAEYERIDADVNLLHKDKRLLLVIHRILQSDADVITLQEVQADQYEVIRSELAHKYESLEPAYHVLTYWTKEWLAKDAEPMQNGQVTFLRKGMFKVLRQKTIQTTDDGSRIQIAALQLTDTFQIFRRSLAKNFILVNQHLESGIQEVKQVTRQKQIIKIHEEAKTMSQELVKSGEPEPRIILVGDFNTYGDNPGMNEVRDQGFVDVAELIRNERPTFIVVGDVKMEFAIDHIAILKADVEAERISAKTLIIPEFTSPEYDAVNHKETILHALYGRLERRVLSLMDALKDTKTFDIITHIPPSRPDFKEHRALKALRVGSDHLPIYAELELA